MSNVDCHDCDCQAPCCTEADTKSLLANYRVAYDIVMPDVERLQSVIDHLLEPLRAIEKELKNIVVESGESISGHGVTITYRSGYERASWNSMALDGYAAAHPEVLSFKSVTKVGPTAAIKVV